jgi:putative aldouronate transport system permease protein
MGRALKFREGSLSKSFVIFNYFLLTVVAFLMLYPFIYVISVSVSDIKEIARGAVVLFPRGFNLHAYDFVFKSNNILLAYTNSIIYTVVGTAFSLIVACLAAYPLAQKRLRGRSYFSFIFVLPMFILAGIIANYLVIAELHMIDTIWAIVIPPAFTTLNILLMRAGFRSIPESLVESAYMDGASDWRILFQIVIPLSKPTLAVVGLFSAVFHWNNFLSPLLYLNNPKLFPMPLILRKVILQSATSPQLAEAVGIRENIPGAFTPLGPGFDLALKMATVAVAIGPIILLYPFLQKYFVKGAMIGSVKE